MGRSRNWIVIALLTIMTAACSEADNESIVLRPEARPGAETTPTTAAGPEPTVLSAVVTQTTEAPSSALPTPLESTPTVPGIVSEPGSVPTATSGAPEAEALPWTTTPPVVTTTIPATTTTVLTTTTTSTIPPPQIEGPEAPDFTLVLAGGAEFTLSLESRPVLLYLWADW